MAGHLTDILVGGGIALASSTVTTWLTSWLTERRSRKKLLRKKLEGLYTRTLKVMYEIVEVWNEFEIEGLLHEAGETLQGRPVVSERDKMTTEQRMGPFLEVMMLTYLYFPELRDRCDKLQEKVFSFYDVTLEIQSETVPAFVEFCNSRRTNKVGTLKSLLSDLADAFKETEAYKKQLEVWSKHQKDVLNELTEFRGTCHCEARKLG